MRKGPVGPPEPQSSLLLDKTPELRHQASPFGFLGADFDVNRRALAREAEQHWTLYCNHLRRSNKDFDLKFLQNLLGVPNEANVAPANYYSRKLGASLALLSRSPNLKSISQKEDLLFAQHLASNFEHVRLTLNHFPLDPFAVLAKKRHIPRSKDSRPLLLLDLDETLVHTGAGDSQVFHTRTRFFHSGERPLELGVNFRPFTLQFLYLTSQCFDLGIFTASTREYAEPLLLLLDPGQTLFKVRLFREDCIQLAPFLFLKELRVVGNRHPGDVYLVDNDAHFFARSLDHGIPILPFTSNSNDCELLHLFFFLVLLLSLPSRELRRECIRSQFKNFLLAQEFPLSDVLTIMS